MYVFEGGLMGFGPMLGIIRDYRLKHKTSMPLRMRLIGIARDNMQ